jgi:hypothetical protein
MKGRPQAEAEILVALQKRETTREQFCKEVGCEKSTNVTL